MYIKCNIGRNLELACKFFYWELFQGTLKWPISHTNEHYITNGKLILHCTQVTRLTKFVCIIYKKNTFFSIFVENCSIYMYLIFSVCSVLVRKKMHISKEWYITEHTPTISIHALEFTCYIKQLHVLFGGRGGRLYLWHFASIFQVNSKILFLLFCFNFWFLL